MAGKTGLLEAWTAGGGGRSWEGKSWERPVITFTVLKKNKNTKWIFAKTELEKLLWNKKDFGWGKKRLMEYAWFEPRT